MKRVLLTGGSGFIGSETVPLLTERGFDVHLVGRHSSPPSREARLERPPTHHALDLLNGDLADLMGEVRPTHLLHLAWFVERGVFWSSPANLDWTAASLRLVRQFASFGGARVVVAGTCAEYDWSQGTLREASTPLRPRTLYGRAKACLFEMLRMAAPDLGVSFGWGRIFFPYGPRDQPGSLLSAAIDQLRAGRPLECTEGSQRRPFIHVEDVAEALVRLLDSPVEGAVNIATDEAASVRELVGVVAEILGAEGLVRFGALPTPPDEPAWLAADVSRLGREVGFRPRFALREGVAKAVVERVAATRRRR